MDHLSFDDNDDMFGTSAAFFHDGDDWSGHDMSMSTDVNMESMSGNTRMFHSNIPGIRTGETVSDAAIRWGIQQFLLSHTPTEYSDPRFLDDNAEPTRRFFSHLTATLNAKLQHIPSVTSTLEVDGIERHWRDFHRREYPLARWEADFRSFIHTSMLGYDQTVDLLEHLKCLFQLLENASQIPDEDDEDDSDFHPSEDEEEEDDEDVDDEEEAEFVVSEADGHGHSHIATVEGLLVNINRLRQKLKLRDATIKKLRRKCFATQRRLKASDRKLTKLRVKTQENMDVLASAKVEEYIKEGRGWSTMFKLRARHIYKKYCTRRVDIAPLLKDTFKLWLGFLNDDQGNPPSWCMPSSCSLFSGSGWFRQLDGVDFEPFVELETQMLNACKRDRNCMFQNLDLALRLNDPVQTVDADPNANASAAKDPIVTITFDAQIVDNNVRNIVTSRTNRSRKRRARHREVDKSIATILNENERLNRAGSSTFRRIHAEMLNLYRAQRKMYFETLPKRAPPLSKDGKTMAVRLSDPVDEDEEGSNQNGDTQGISVVSASRFSANLASMAGVTAAMLPPVSILDQSSVNSVVEDSAMIYSVVDETFIETGRSKRAKKQSTIRPDGGAQVQVGERNQEGFSTEDSGVIINDLLPLEECEIVNIDAATVHPPAIVASQGLRLIEPNTTSISRAQAAFTFVEENDDYCFEDEFGPLVILDPVSARLPDVDSLCADHPLYCQLDRRLATDGIQLFDRVEKLLRDGPSP